MVLVEALRKNFPQAHIGFIGNERTAGLIRMNASIDQTFEFHRDLFRRLWRKHPFLFIRKLKAWMAMIRAERFDAFFDLSLGREFSFFGMLIGIRKRIGFDFKGRGVFLTHRKKIRGYEDRSVADIQLGLLDFLGISYQRNELKPSLNVSRGIQNETDAFLKKHRYFEQDPILAVAPGGGRSWGKDAIFKQWDADRFATAINAFLEKRPWKVILLGDRSEAELLGRTADLICAPKIVVVGEPMERVSALLLKAQLLLCNDGGLLHLANALGVKTVSIFGPVDEKVYGPIREDVLHEVVTEPVPCRPCYQKFYFPPCPYERRCLTQLSVKKVVAALTAIA